MTLAFPDLSNFQAGLRIQPGTVAVIAKATEGTYYTDNSYHSFMQQADAVGAIKSAYHFLKQEGSAADQARFAFAFVGTMAQMIDVETEGASKPGMLEIMSYIETTKALGGRVWGVYLPHWYWQEIGSPDLTPIANAGVALVSSAYDYVGADNGVGWQPYGGVTPSVWQYTDKLAYGGQSVDFNAFRGTVEQLRTLITGAGAAPAPAPSGGPVATATQLDLWGYKGPGDNPDVHQTLQNIDKQTVDVGAQVWSFKNPAAGDTVDMRQLLVNLAADIAAIKAKLGA